MRYFWLLFIPALCFAEVNPIMDKHNSLNEVDMEVYNFSLNAQGKQMKIYTSTPIASTLVEREPILVEDSGAYFWMTRVDDKIRYIELKTK